MDETSPAPGSAPLNGWKEIASYLGRSVRAVQRWEHELGLPVHRIRTHDGQSVYAFREEIDKWRDAVDAPKTGLPAGIENGGSAPDDAGRTNGNGLANDSHVASANAPVEAPPLPRSGGRQLAWLAGGVAILATVLLLLWPYLGRSAGATAHGPAVRVHFEDNILRGLDVSGLEVWRYPFVNPAGRPILERATAADLDADGLTEFIVGVRFSPPQSEAPVSDAVYAFTNDGEVRWKVAPAMTLTCGGKTFDSPWQVKATTVEDTEGPRRTWIAWVHHTFHPSFVIEVAPRDNDQSLRYVQAGWVVSLHHWRTPAGPLLAAGGVLNEYGRASLALLQTDGPVSTSPAADAAFQCGGSTAGVLRVNLLPRIETSINPYDFVTELRPIGPDLKASQDGRAAIAVIGPDLRVKDYSVSDNYSEFHRNREAPGHPHPLNHPLEQCPFPNADKEILAWTPANGWERHTIRPMPWVAPKTPK